MNLRSKVASLMAAAALTALMAGPAVADPPQFYGVITCDAYGVQDREMSDLQWWTKKSIAAWKRDMSVADDCVNGSFGFNEYPPPA